MTTPTIPRTSGIYKITCVPTGKFYIGSAVNLAVRWTRHKTKLRGHCHYNEHLQRAWNNLSESDFIFEIIEECNRVDLLAREQFWLDKLRPFGMQGFNMATSALSPALGRKHTLAELVQMSTSRLGIKFSPEHCANISAAKKGCEVTLETRSKISAAGKGRKHTSEALARMSAAQSGHKCTEATRAKIGAAQKGRRHTAEHCAKCSAATKGISKTLEQRMKISQGHIGIKPTEEIKAKISQSLAGSWLVTNPDGVETKIASLKRFCRENNLHDGHMIEVANGKSLHHKGWKCRREEGSE